MSREKEERPHVVKVILNADDLGLDEKTNAAIFHLMSKGRVTSASLLANGSAFEDAVTRARDFPRSSFGVHLNLTQGFPLTAHPGLGVILNPDGSFRRDKIRHLFIDQSLRRAVLAEWTAQAGKVLGSGLPVSHLDGHHHVHTIPGLFLTLKRLQRRVHIRRVRLSRNMHAPNALPPWYRRIAKALWNLGLRHVYRTEATEGYTSLQVFLGTANNTMSSVQSVELMVHPGHQDFEEETRLLAGEWWKDLPFEIQTINYHEL